MAWRRPVFRACGSACRGALLGEAVRRLSHQPTRHILCRIRCHSWKRWYGPRTPSGLVWGTDWPHPAVQLMPEQERQYRRSYSWPPGEELRRAGAGAQSGAALRFRLNNIGNLRKRKEEAKMRIRTIGVFTVLLATLLCGFAGRARRSRRLSSRSAGLRRTARRTPTRPERAPSSRRWSASPTGASRCSCFPTASSATRSRCSKACARHAGRCGDHQRGGGADRARVPGQRPAVPVFERGTGAQGARRQGSSQRLAKKLEGKGIVALGFMEGGLHHMINNAHPVRRNRTM